MTTARFETMLGLQSQLDERRRRLMTSALMAATVCMAAGLFTWVGDKMGIAAVTPPKNRYSVSLQMALTPPPQAPPPKRGFKDGDDEQKKEEPKQAKAQVQPPPPDEELIEEIDPRPRPKAAVPSSGESSSSGPSKGPRGVEWGGIAGDPRSKCLLPPCLGDGPVTKDPPLHTKTQKPESPVQAPIKTVMASSIYTPNPSAKALARTRTGLTRRTPGKTSVSFCIDTKGHTYKVRVKSPFGSDPEVDKICRDTVKKWTFHPQKVGAKARSTCSTVVFDIRFD